MSGDQIEVLPPLYAAVLETGTRLMKQHPRGVSTETIGITAWNSLAPEQRREELGHVLGAYVSRVHDEERTKTLEARAADPTHTYLDDHDVTILSDSTATTANDYGEVLADRVALFNVLCELELLQHRLAMRTQQGGA